MPDLTSISGLPAHPLFVHIPVVLIPLGAIGAVAMLWPRVRDRIGWVVVGIVFVAGIATQLAISSGKDLEDHVRESALLREHTRMGENIRPWVLLMFLALLGVMVVARLRRRRPDVSGPPAGRDVLKIVGILLSACSIVFAGMATYWIYRIGHSGSKAVWAPTQVKIDKGGGERGGEGDDGG
jgi:uncharacterized membrane protein